MYVPVWVGSFVVEGGNMVIYCNFTKYFSAMEFQIFENISLPKRGI